MKSRIDMEKARLKSPLLALCLILGCTLTGPLPGAEMTFEADAKLANKAAKRAAELAAFVSAKYAQKLDYSDDSIELIDPILDELHSLYVDEQPPEEQIVPLAEGFGSYIGEVYRKNHGGTWGWITEGERVFPGIKPERGGLFWPWAKALDRIKTQTEPSISDYYHFLVIR